MGGYYARAQGLPDVVADAIRDHYKPVGQGDEVPTAPVTVAVSLADKLDSLAVFFAINERPTGSKDPFALRRAAIAIIQQIVVNDLRFSLETAFGEGYINFLQQHIDRLETYVEKGVRKSEVRDVEYPRSEDQTDEYFRLLLDFFADRLKVQQREAGVRHDLIDAVFALGGEDDLVRLLARVKALQSFIVTDDGANLLTGYKRAANILKKEGWDGAPSSAVTPAEAGVHGSSDEGTTQAERDMDSRLRGNDDGGLSGKSLSYTPEKEEAALIAALDEAEQRAVQAVAAEDFEGAMSALAGLRAPIDAFFDKVTVNDPDADKRAARLALLARIRDAVHKVADFSRIEG